MKSYPNQSNTCNPILVTVSRSGKTETQFRGSVSIVGAGGQELFSIGNTTAHLFPRSTLKLFQVLPLLISGAASHFGFSPAEIALMCGSHNGELQHLNAVTSILNKTKLSKEYLGCGSHNPLGISVYENLIRAGQSPGQVHNNCSGKHAGFLALSHFLGAPLGSYLEPDHPVQLRIKDIVSNLCEVPVKDMTFGLDGCSAPNYGMPLKNLAKGYQRFAASVSKSNLNTDNRNQFPPKNQPSDLDFAILETFQGISQNPFMIGGSNRFCTEMLETCAPEIIGKLGAAGIYCLAIPPLNWGIAIKMDDGSTGPQYTVATEIIRRLGIFQSHQLLALDKYRQTPILNCKGLQVGDMRLSVEGEKILNEFFKN